MTPKDHIIAAAVILFSMLLCLVALNLSAHPFEDAAILMRYAVNLASGHGIVWNIGEHPIDGGTDLLFMCSAALFHAFGMSIEISVRSLSALSHFLTIYLIYYTLRSRQGASRWIAGMTALFFAVGPGLYYFASYFGTSFFGLFVALHWFFALEIMKSARPARSQSILFSLSSLFLGLARPEGAILAVLVFAGIAAAKGWNAAKYHLTYFLVLFAGIGSLYFLWRWNYFGYPLPNPFYKKGGGTLHWDSLLYSSANAVRLTLPFLLPFAAIGLLMIANVMKRGKFSSLNSFYDRSHSACLIPIIGFTLIWVLLSNEMNYFMRFQYPVLILVLMSWYPAAKKLAGTYSPSIETPLANILGITCLIFIVAYQSIANNHSRLLKPDGRYTVAQILSDFRNEGYTLATSEAGLLPLYSGWRTIDTWGLNDAWIAHNGMITGEYLDRFKPEVLMVLAYYTPIATEYEPIPFVDHVKVIKEYAEKNRYELAASFGISPFSSHCYYVRRDFRHREEIIRKISEAEYHWFTTGEKCVNFVNYAVK